METDYSGSQHGDDGIAVGSFGFLEFAEQMEMLEHFILCVHVG